MDQEHGHEATETGQTQESSYWPVILAATLTLTLVGLVVHPAISLVGAVLCIIALIAWNAQRFQGPSHLERVPAEVADLLALGVDGGVVDRLRESSIRSGRWGLIWFISSEAVFFANLIAAYLYLRVSSPIWPPPGSARLELLFASLNTVLLLLSTVPAYYAHQAIKKGDQTGLRLGLIVAALLGALFLAGQGYEYATMGLTPQTNMFAAGFYVLTGFHGAHVAAGIGLLLVVFMFSLRGRFTAQRYFAVEVASTYWHFVDVVWVFLFTILYVFQ